MTSIEPRALYTFTEAALIIAPGGNLSGRALRDAWAREGRPLRKIGKRLFVHGSSVLEYLDEPCPPTPKAPVSICVVGAGAPTPGSSATAELSAQRALHVAATLKRRSGAT